VLLEQGLKPLAASLGYGARVPPAAWSAGGGLVEGDGLGVLGEGRGARTSFFAVVTGLLLALHGFAFPSIRALVLS